MNEQSEQSVQGTNNSETTQEFSLSAEADKLIAESEAQSASGSSEESLDGGKLGAPQQNAKDESELSAEEILKQVTAEQANPKVNEELLKGINELGAIHNGLPVKFDSIEQLKEVVQKGFDYTKKTMALSEAEKTFNDQKVKTETELNAMQENFVQKEAQLAEVITENDTMTAVLQKMKNSDPELFEEFRHRYEAEMSTRQAAMPYMKQFENQFQGLQKEIEGLKQTKVTEELNGIKSNWQNDLTQTQTKYAPVIAKLGVKADWDKVKEVWAADATGKMSVEQAFQAVHGAEISKAFTSHKKLLETKSKTANAMLKKTGVSGHAGTRDDSKGNHDLGSYLRNVVETL